jgi:hypothetical protein
MHTIRVAKKQSEQPWDIRLVEQVGKAMRRVRRRKGKPANWLSDETARLGLRVSPQVIAKLDSAHRGSALSVSELLVLAAALEVPPALLLFPGYPDGWVEFLPGRAAESKAAVEWFSGEARLPAPETDGGEREASPPNPGTELVKAMRQIVDITKDFVALTEMLRAQQVPDEVASKMRTEWEDRLIELQAEVMRQRIELEEDPR